MHQYEQKKHEARFVHVDKYVFVFLNLTDRNVMFDSQHMIEFQTNVLITWINVKQQKKDMSAFAFVAVGNPNVRWYKAWIVQVPEDRTIR